MKKLVLSALLLTFTLGLSNTALADTKIGVIDIPAVIEKSNQVKALQNEQNAKIQELEKWLKTAQADINKQKTEEGKDKLVKKYQADFAKKQEAIAKNYQSKLEDVDKNITQAIIAEAKKLGNDIVISKGVVVYGGDDITEQIKKVVK